MQTSRDDVDSLRPLNVSIISVNEVSGHTEYTLRLSIPHLASSSWTVDKRYNDFVSLHNSTEPYGVTAELPPKKAFGNKEREFVAERQRALEAYCRNLLGHIYIFSSKPFKQFLHPGPRLADLANSALQLMAMVFRTDHRYELSGHLPSVGWRNNKEFGVVKSLADPKHKLIGCWTFYGPDRTVSAADISAFLQSLSQTNHPLFYPLLFADARDTGCVCVRVENSQGSLLDIIKNSKNRQPFLQKYAKTKRGKGLTMDDVQKFGRQILEALKFFHDSCIPYGNLSSRNVIIDAGQARITEIENGICGLRSFYWPFILQYRKICTFEAMDVYCFGHVLYEMVFGQALETPVCDSISPACPPLVRAVLESILTPEACKVGMPTVSQLLTQPLFHSVTLNYDPASMKISRSLKEALTTAKKAMEAKMVEEQKLYHAHQKEMKVHTFQSSEDEKKKRRLLQLKSQISTDVAGGDNHSVNGRATTPTNLPSIGEVPSTSVSGNSKAMAPKTPGPPPPPPPPSNLNVSIPVKLNNVPPEVSGKERSVLLASIRGFNKSHLSQAETDDKSAPVM